MDAPKARKKTGGRKKIPMVRIEDDKKRRTTLSKRRGGLFKKAQELTTLCGAQVAVIVFSPSGSAKAFGHPSVESVANRFFNETAPKDPTNLVQNKAELKDSKELFDRIDKLIEAEKKRGLLKLAVENTSGQLSDANLNRMDFIKLKGVKENMVSEDVDLGKFEGDGMVVGGDASPIPSDWLKL